MTSYICLATMAASLRVNPIDQNLAMESSLPEFFIPFPNDLHQDLLHFEKDDGKHFQHKTLGTMMKIGREDSTKCLSFLHIPKNAGTTIEGIPLEKSSREHVFVVSTSDPSVKHWGKFDTSLQCESPANRNEKCFFKTEKGKGRCSIWHIPPHLDKKLADSYTSNGCETFCVVRSPSEKLFSELKYRGGMHGKCDMESYLSGASSLMKRISSDHYVNDCHSVPQTEFIYGDSSYPKYCQHQLRMENLEEDFNNLMKNFGINATLSKHLNAMDCEIPLKERDSDPKVHEFITTYYRDDLKNFNYTV